MSPQEFWLLVEDRIPKKAPDGGPTKIGSMDRSTFDELVEELHA